MSLAMGGHLTHGSPVNLSGKLYRVVSYGLTEKEEIDYGRRRSASPWRRSHKLIVTGARPMRSPSTGSAFAPSPTNAARC